MNQSKNVIYFVWTIYVFIFLSASRIIIILIFLILSIYLLKEEESEFFLNFSFVCRCFRIFGKIFI